MSDQDTALALAVVARKVLADLVQSEAPQMWELYPELGEGDWLRVLLILGARTKAPEPWRCREALDILAARAEVTT